MRTEILVEVKDTIKRKVMFPESLKFESSLTCKRP